MASANRGKLEEFGGFSSKSLFFSPPPRVIPVQETGETFEENAFLKARSYFEAFGGPVLSDDSGLVVPAFPDELGVHSARFGEGGWSDATKNSFLLERLSSEVSREGFFLCKLCLFISCSEIFFFEGRLEGKISKENRGSEGFGYDPIFIPDSSPGEKTLAELFEWKKSHSHRARAMVKLISFFDQKLPKFKGFPISALYGGA